MQPVEHEIIIAPEFKELFNPYWRFFAIYGGRGGLKSHTVARVLLIKGRQKKMRILCTREIQKTIADSVHKLLKDIIAEYGMTDYEVTDKTIRNNVTGTEFIFAGLWRNTTEIKSMEGIDICWVEEAQTVSDESMDVLTPTIRKEGSQIIYTYNRVNELDPVHVRYVMNKGDHTCVIKVNYDVAQKYGWFPDVLQIEMEADKANPDVFAHKWLGEPMGQAEMSIISRTETLAAMSREIEGDGAEEYGVDVARMGNDRSVFWHRKGLKTLRHETHSKLKIPALCDALEKFMDFDKVSLLKIDDTGVGGGVTDEMEKRGYNVMPINFGGEPEDKDKYPNWISEAWFHMGDIMSEAELPFDSDLLMELTTRIWQQDNKGKRAVESKKDYKKRMKTRSPDLADACIICYYTPIPQVIDWGGADDVV